MLFVGYLFAFCFSFNRKKNSSSCFQYLGLLLPRVRRFVRLGICYCVCVACARASAFVAGLFVLCPLCLR